MTVRRGYSLIEVTVAMTLIGAVMSSAALLTHATRQADRRVRNAAALEADLGRLAVQLRSDAHRANSARIEAPKAPGPGPSVLSLALPDELQAEYTLDAREIRRVLRRGGTVLHRESYSRDPAVPSRWAVREAGRRQVVSLVVEPAEAVSTTDAPVSRIDAAVNLFRSSAAASNPGGRP